MRCSRAHADGLSEDLAWFGLYWDAVELQSAFGAEQLASDTKFYTIERFLANDRLTDGYSELTLKRALNNSWMLSADVNDFLVDAARSSVLAQGFPTPKGPAGAAVLRPGRGGAGPGPAAIV